MGRLKRGRTKLQLESKRSLWVGGVGACLLCVAFSASAQESAGNSAAPANSSGAVIGPPQLRDFRLQPQERIVTQPAPATPPVELAPPPPATDTAPQQPAPRTAARQAQTQQRRPVETQAQPGAAGPAEAAPAPTTGAPIFEPAPAPAPVAEPPAEAPVASQEQGTSNWLYAIPVAALALLGLALARRRRRNRQAEVIAEPAPVAAPPPKPRPEPVARPWLELELKTDRASFTPAEAMIQFELSVRNTGKSAARNLRLDVKMFNAGREQDEEIGAFFKSAGRESTKLTLPGIGAENEGVIRGEVAMPREEMRAVRLDDRLLFIPVIAVNILYDWGDGRTGQTSKSYVVGRELQEQSEKMGAFRVDQGPRIWRTVGQRPHKLAKRV